MRVYCTELTPIDGHWELLALLRAQAVEAVFIERCLSQMSSTRECDGGDRPTGRRRTLLLAHQREKRRHSVDIAPCWYLQAPSKQALRSGQACWVAHTGCAGSCLTPSLSVSRT